jgi:type IV secretory pathway VirB10-like protein
MTKIKKPLFYQSCFTYPPPPIIPYLLLMTICCISFLFNPCRLLAAKTSSSSSKEIKAQERLISAALKQMRPSRSRKKARTPLSRSVSQTLETLAQQLAPDSASLSTHDPNNDTSPIAYEDCVQVIHKSTQPVCFIHPGFTFDAALITSILSFNAITPVIAETEYDITHLGKVIFPRGTKIIGSSNLVKTLDRVNVQFHTIVYPNGQWIPFQGLALHTDGSGGIPGIVKKEKAAVPARVLLRTAGAATTIASQQPLAGEMIAGIAGEAGKELQEKESYSITVKKGIPIIVYIIQEINF